MTWLAKADRSTLLEELSPPEEELPPPEEEEPLPEEEPLSDCSVQLHRTMQVADRPVAESVTVMVALPGATAVTVPLAETVATLSSLDVQVKVPPEGSALAFSCQVAPAEKRVKSLLLRERELSATGSSAPSVELSGREASGVSEGSGLELSGRSNPSSELSEELEPDWLVELEPPGVEELEPPLPPQAVSRAKERAMVMVRIRFFMVKTPFLGAVMYSIFGVHEGFDARKTKRFPIF